MPDKLEFTEDQTETLSAYLDDFGDLRMSAKRALTIGDVKWFEHAMQGISDLMDIARDYYISTSAVDPEGHSNHANVLVYELDMSKLRDLLTDK